MPAEGVPLSPRAHLLTRDELARLVRVFAGAGVDKLRLTGGEPTLRSDLADIIREALALAVCRYMCLCACRYMWLCVPTESVKAVSGIRSVAITTNGLVLTRRLPALQRAGLDAINVSLDSLRAHRYERMSRRPVPSFSLSLALAFAPYVCPSRVTRVCACRSAGAGPRAGRRGPRAAARLRSGQDQHGAHARSVLVS